MLLCDRAKDLGAKPLREEDGSGRPHSPQCFELDISRSKINNQGKNTNKKTNYELDLIVHADCYPRAHVG